jgi:hypothetical protein
MSPGCEGCHFMRPRVSALDAGLFIPRKPAGHEKCAGASSGATALIALKRLDRELGASLRDSIHCFA